MTATPSTLWYFPIEDVPSRYTSQLCRNWMPSAFRETISRHKLTTNVVALRPDVTQEGRDIEHGQVLDGIGRGDFALAQCRLWLSALRAGQVRDGDALYFQDFWTPGVEAIMYALHQTRTQCTLSGMLHAQTADRYDFTYPMRSWMRPIERGIASAYQWTMLASSIHAKHLEQAGIRLEPLVVGLPISIAEVLSHVPSMPVREKRIVATSRLDREKNPTFMLAVAERFLERHPNYEWWITTSAATARSNDSTVLAALATACSEQPRLRLYTGLSKRQYYDALAGSAVQFNCSAQDYVSWTLLEAVVLGCDICYPDWRSFPECVPASRRYPYLSMRGALEMLERCISTPRTHRSIAERCDSGRYVSAEYVLGRREEKGWNVWQA